MRILVVGGTRFVGRHLVAAALAAGHQLTLLHRGRTGRGLFPEAEHLTGDRDRDGDLGPLLAGREWDATVDTCAYRPGQVHALADALGGRGGRHLLVSSVSAYAAPDGPGFDEDAPLAELTEPADLADPAAAEVTAATYGGLKVRCERAARERHGRATILVRPTFVVGPEDYTWRFPWWVERIAAGGAVVVPGPADAPAQVVDARDLGAWMVRLLQDGGSGAYHAAAPRPPYTWGELVQAVVDTVGPLGTSVRWVTPGAVAAAGIDPDAVPLWVGEDPARWMMAADPSRAYASGLAPRPLSETVADTLVWLRGPDAGDRPPGVGLTREQERTLRDAD